MSAGISASRRPSGNRLGPLRTIPHRGEAGQQGSRLQPDREYFFWPFTRIGIASAIYCIAAVATLILSAPRLAQAQETPSTATGTIRVVVPQNFPPEYSLDKNGKPQGFARWHGTPPPYWMTRRVFYLGGLLFGLFLLLALGGSWLWRYRYLRRVQQQLEEEVKVRTRLAGHHAARFEAANKELETLRAFIILCQPKWLDFQYPI
jgi:hypothetical protein